MDYVPCYCKVLLLLPVALLTESQTLLQDVKKRQQKNLAGSAAPTHKPDFGVLSRLRLLLLRL